MHRLVAIETKAGEVLERVVRAVFVAVVDVYGGLAMLSAACLAFATGVLPAIRRGLSVLLPQAPSLLLMRWRSAVGSAVQPVLLALTVLGIALQNGAAVRLAKPRSVHSGGAALHADPGRSSFGAALLGAGPISDKARRAHSSPLLGWSATANALVLLFSQERVQRVFVASQLPGNGSHAAKFFVEAKRLLTINFHPVLPVGLTLSPSNHVDN